MRRYTHLVPSHLTSSHVSSTHWSINTHTHICIRTCIQTHRRAHTCLHASICACKYAFMHTHTHIACIQPYIHASMHVSAHTLTHAPHTVYIIEHHAPYDDTTREQHAFVRLSTTRTHAQHVRNNCIYTHTYMHIHATQMIACTPSVGGSIVCRSNYRSTAPRGPEWPTGYNDIARRGRARTKSGHNRRMLPRVSSGPRLAESGHAWLNCRRVRFKFGRARVKPGRFRRTSPHTSSNLGERSPTWGPEQG